MMNFGVHDVRAELEMELPQMGIRLLCRGFVDNGVKFLSLLEVKGCFKGCRHGGVWLLREVTLIGITGPS